MQVEAGLMNITELEAGFMLIKYTSLSEIEAELMQGIILKCRPIDENNPTSLAEIEAGYKL